MADTNNSLSTILNNFVILQNNALETLQKLQQATISVAETIIINVTNVDGTVSPYTIPSFGYLKANFERIDATIQKMLGFDGSAAYIRQPDGTFKKIYQAKTPVNPAPVGNVLVPATFQSESNWFFENMMSPEMFVNFDVTSYISQQESKIYAKRMMLNLSTQAQIDYFNNTLRGRNDIDYNTLLVDLQTVGITFFIDEGVLELPLSVVRFTGDFTPVNYEDRTFTNSDGTISTKRFYLFDKLTYTDNLALSKGTMTLRVGNQLINGETIYEIQEIDTTTNYVRVKRLSGYEPISIGAPVAFFSEVFSPKMANVNIGFGEYTVVFFKSINDEDNLMTTIWSPGVSFYTNDLTINLTTGLTTLTDYYHNNVLDFGNMLLSMARDGWISAFDGMIPNAPVLDVRNFQVVQINGHKLDSAQIEAIRKKQSDKVKIASEIQQLTKSIDSKNEELNSKKFNSDTERRAAKNQLDSLIRQKASNSALYASIVADLNSIAQQQLAVLDTPKYNIRGFFQIPEPRYSEKTGKQQVIQFLTYYRYTRPDGSASDIKQFDYTDPNGSTQRATFSNLNEFKSETRKKIYDTNTGKYIWATQNIADPDVVNINQIDIPITPGENVDFYVVAVSEAGWPYNPILSNPSNTITVPFPNDLVTEDEATIALRQASQEAVRVQLEADLAAKGLDQHLSSSFTAVEKYYAHNADVISSNFYTQEGNVISLYEKLKEYETRIQDLENRLNQVVKPLSVFLLDEQNNTKLPVQIGDTINLFSGYYADQVSLLPTAQQRGAIITKTYKLILQNDTASPLAMISRFPGGFGKPAPYSGIGTAPTGTSVVNDPDYNNYRKYDIVPIVNLGIGESDTNNVNLFTTAYYQSGQLLGQFLYSRYTDVGLTNPLYAQPVNRNFLPDVGTGIVPSGTTGSGVYGAISPFVWNMSAASVTPISIGGSGVGNGFLTRFCVHIQHPAINSPSSVTSPQTLQLPTVTLDINSGLPQSPEVVSEFLQAQYFNVASPPKFTSSLPLQLAYQNNNLNIVGTAPFPPTYTPSSVNELPGKFGFVENDRYLIGSQTVGAYLYAGPAQFNQLIVNGVDAKAFKLIQPDDANAIVVPVVFQYRMTDYFGPSISSNLTSAAAGGIGILGGYDPQRVGTLKNLTYTKKIGIDLYQQDQPVFSFDIQVSTTYKKDSLAQLEAVSVPQVAKQITNVSFNKTSVKQLYNNTL